jgi:hypothetical protein
MYAEAQYLLYKNNTFRASVGFVRLRFKPVPKDVLELFQEMELWTYNNVTRTDLLKCMPKLRRCAALKTLIIVPCPEQRATFGTRHRPATLTKMQGWVDEYVGKHVRVVGERHKGKILSLTSRRSDA